MHPFSLLLPVARYVCLPMFLLFSLNLLWFSPNTSASALGNQTDHLALLKFKESISKDPYGVLESWNSSTHFCNWHGIACSLKHQRVVELDLGGYQLHGHISPQVGNLSFLRYLILENNSFYGKIPQELGRLFRLQQLSVINNSLDGEFPSNLTSCFELRGLYLGGNNLSGKILNEIGSFLKLQILRIGKNSFTGKIPPSIGNLSSLIEFSVGNNNLEGDIPEEMRNLKRLTIITVHGNKLSEYGMGTEVSIEGDMYSFGILILEMLTGIRPTDEMFKDGQNLHHYVKISIPNHLVHIVDPTILNKGLEEAANNEHLTPTHLNVKKCLHSLFKIALACSMESPKERMNMIDVTRELDLIRHSFYGGGISEK